MDRRDFIKSGLLAAAVGAMSGPKAIAQEAERQVAREQLSKDILNYNPRMQYRPMGRTGVNVSALGFGMGLRDAATANEERARGFRPDHADGAPCH